MDAASRVAARWKYVAREKEVVSREEEEQAAAAAAEASVSVHPYAKSDQEARAMIYIRRYSNGRDDHQQHVQWLVGVFFFFLSGGKKVLQYRGKARGMHLRKTMIAMTCMSKTGTCIKRTADGV